MTDYRIDQLTAVDAPVAADQIPLWDASIGATRKATLTQLGAGLAVPAVVAGSFTPTISFAGGTTGITYNGGVGLTQAGGYVRIGNLVWFAARLTLTSKGSSSGALRLEGLPYTVGILNTPFSLYVASLPLSAGLALQGLLIAGTTYASLYKQYFSGGASPVTEADVGATSQFLWSGVYLAA